MDLNMEELTPKVVNDIALIEDKNLKGEIQYLIGSKSIDRYLKIGKGKYDMALSIILMMDGENTLAVIKSNVEKYYNIEINVVSLYKKLKNAGLLYDSQNNKSNSEMSIVGIKIFTKNFNEPSNCIKKIISFVWKIFFILSITLVIVGIPIILVNVNKNYLIVKRAFLVYRNSYIQGIVIAYLASIFSTIVHELAHIFTGIKNGLQLSEFNISLYGCIYPIYYSKYKGMYTIPVKKRIEIMSAGLYINLIISVVALLLINIGVFGSRGIEIFTKIMISNLLSIVGNISPFRLCDGYYIFTMIFDMPNLRINMWKSIIRFIKGQKKLNIKKVNVKVFVYLLVCTSLLIVSYIYSIDWVRRILNELKGTVFFILVIVLIFSQFLLGSIVVVRRIKHYEQEE